MDNQKVASPDTSTGDGSSTSDKAFKPNPEKMKQLHESLGNVKIGGKGTPRRKVKNIRRPPNADDKKLQSSLKKLAANPIQGIEEVNMFKDNGEVIQFTNPKVQASLGSNTFAISGQCETKSLQEMLPSIIQAMGGGMGGMDANMAANLARQAKMSGGQGGETYGQGEHAVGDDDDVPDLVENFDASLQE